MQIHAKLTLHCSRFSIHWVIRTPWIECESCNASRRQCTYARSILDSSTQTLASLAWPPFELAGTCVNAIHSNLSNWPSAKFSRTENILLIGPLFRSTDSHSRSSLSSTSCFIFSGENWELYHIFTTHHPQAHSLLSSSTYTTLSSDIVDSSGNRRTFGPLPRCQKHFKRYEALMSLPNRIANKHFVWRCPLLIQYGNGISHHGRWPRCDSRKSGQCQTNRCVHIYNTRRKPLCVQGRMGWNGVSGWNFQQRRYLILFLNGSMFTGSEEKRAGLVGDSLNVWRVANETVF